MDLRLTEIIVPIRSRNERTEGWPRLHEMIINQLEEKRVKATDNESARRSLFAVCNQRHGCCSCCIPIYPYRPPCQCMHHHYAYGS